MKNYFPYSAVTKEFENQPQQEMAPGMLFQHFHTPSMTIVRWEFKKGVVIQKHSHPNEQVVWLPKGSARVIINEDEEHHIKEGQIFFIPPNVPHEFFILEDSIDVDIFTPPRQDWIDGIVSYSQESDQ